jgi:hypothetical protein
LSRLRANVSFLPSTDRSNIACRQINKSFFLFCRYMKQGIMEQQLERTYGTPRAIRYLVNSVDDLREVADTVLFIIRHNCRPEHYRSLKRAITLSAIPMPQSLSSFIIGFDIPTDLLQRASVIPAKASAGIAGDPESEVSDCFRFPEPEIQTTEKWSEFSYNLTSLNDLFCALHTTTRLLQSGSERFEYVNLKRRTRLSVVPAKADSRGFRISFRVPAVLQRV